MLGYSCAGRGRVEGVNGGGDCRENGKREGITFKWQIGI